MAAPQTPSATYKMLSVAEALELVLSETEPLSAETVALAEAFQHTLAVDVLAPEAVPAYRASIKDGYAVLSSDGPGEYEVASESFAGVVPEPLRPGTVAYIGTGGPVPDGADAVVQVEDTEFLGAGPSGARRVRINKAAPPGCDIRKVGSDVARGEVVLPAGQYLGAAEVGILATAGAAMVQVLSKPHVAVLSSGDELRSAAAGSSADPGARYLVRDANGPMLLAAARAAGASTTDLGIARDTAEEVEAALDRAIEAGADVLLTSGGVSMGDKDFVKPLLERRGRIFFGKVCMKPGKPLTFALVPTPGRSRGLLVFGLPGNPVSSLVTFYLVVLPCLRKMEGWQEPALRRVHARTSMAIRMDPERPEYHRAVAHWARRPGTGSAAEGCDGELVACSTGGQISSRLLSMRSANLLLEIPQASGVLAAGSVVSALVIGDLGAMPVVEALPATTLSA